MAVEKTINGRSVQKHDTEANWNNNGKTFVPKKGEIIFYDKDATHSYERMKVGDGSTTVVNLPFVSVNQTELNTQLTNLQTKVTQSEIQVSTTQPTFACTWFRPTSTT